MNKDVLGMIIALIVIGAVADLVFFHILRQELIPLAVIIGGILILFNKGDSNNLYTSSPDPLIGIRPKSRFIRRWVFGIVLIFMGIYSYELLNIEIFGEFLKYLSVYTLSGQIIVCLIVVINVFDRSW